MGLYDACHEESDTGKVWQEIKDQATYAELKKFYKRLEGKKDDTDKK
jgi:hypothetical protein